MTMKCPHNHLIILSILRKNPQNTVWPTFSQLASIKLPSIVNPLMNGLAMLAAAVIYI